MNNTEKGREKKCDVCCWEKSNPHRCGFCCKCRSKFISPLPTEKGKQDWIEKLQEISSLWLYDGAEWENAILFIEELLTSQEKKIREEERHFLQEVKKYIEDTEEKIDWEWGKCRDFNEILKDDDLREPELYQKVLGIINKE